VAPYYVNPLSLGLPNNPSSLTSSSSSAGSGGTGGGGGGGSTKAFGQPLFSQANTSLSSASASRGGGAGGSGMGTGGMGRTTAMSVGPRYTQGIGWQANLPTPARIQTELQSLVVNSPRLVNARGIQVVMDGSTVVLRGTAADEHDRALAAAMIGMTPGVYGVRNELKVAPPTAIPAGTQRP
jgi:hypothetical protein